MQQPAPTQPSPTHSDFAGLLATLASPTPDAAEDAPLWNSSDLGEDVASLSYERALRAHARYRPLGRNPDRDLDRGDGLPVPPDYPSIGTDTNAAIDRIAAAAEALQPAVAPDRDLRSASVTIRLSKAECARLHRRAAEAGLTVSAYLRSCALEAETLRAQVKQALAEIKAGTEGPSQKKSKEAREQGTKKPGWRNFFGWLAWLTKRGR
jgi:predicted DNA binding CopG/RHH family protein